MRKISILTFILATLSATAFAETVHDIIHKFETEKAAALEAYLKANPDAADASEAQDALISAYTAAHNTDKVEALLLARYDGASKGTDGVPRDIAMNVLRPLFGIHGDAGKKTEALALADRVKKDFADHKEIDQLAGFIDQLTSKFNQPMVGDVMDIQFTSLAGKEINLADYKGKVVLVDFWATWCGPCIAELPNVKSTYTKHHDAGFDVIAISLDKDKKALEDFIAKEELPWPQMFDGEAWKTKYAKEFGITGIPATFLIGPDGKVAETNLRGDELEKAVAKLLADK